MRALRSALALVLLSGLAGCAGGGYGSPAYAEPGYGGGYGPSVGFAYGGGYPVYYGGGYPTYYRGNYPYWQQPNWRNWHDNDWHNSSWNNGHWTPPPNNGQWNNKQWNNQGNWQGNKPPQQWATQNGAHTFQNPLYNTHNNLNSR